MVIKKLDGTTVSSAVVLQTYFGRKESQTIAQFMDEVRELSQESKDELAVLAAEQLGYTVSE